jgi:hypothetical protein
MKKKVNNIMTTGIKYYDYSTFVTRDKHFVVLYGREQNKGFNWLNSFEITTDLYNKLTKGE